MVERRGRVRALVTGDVKTRTLLPLIDGNIDRRSRVVSDDARQYRPLSRHGYRHHAVINHSARIYVDGDVRANTIEGFWSLLKNGIRGVHHMVGTPYLQSYVDEYVFRYNHRDDEQPMFRTLVERAREARTGRYGTYSPVGG